MMRLPARRRLMLTAVLLLIALTGTGCVGTRLDVAWAAVQPVGETQNILVAYRDYIVLVDPRTGQLVQLTNEQGETRLDEEGNPRLWQVAGLEDGPQFYAEPLLLDDGNVLAADYQNSRLLTVNLETARIGPTAQPVAGQVLAALVSDGEQVFLPLNDHGLQAVDLNTLEQNWLFETENGVWAAPLILDETLYFTSMDHFLYAVDASSGEEIWRVDLEGAAAGTPTLANDRLYVGSFARKVFEVSLEGEILNTFEAANWVWGTPVVVDETVYAADLSGVVYALSVDGLELQWDTQATPDGIRPTPLVTEDYVVVGSQDGRVVWLARTTLEREIDGEVRTFQPGEIVYDREVGAEILSDILLIEPSESLDIPEPLVVISTVASDRVLVAFTLDSAARRWVYAR